MDCEYDLCIYQDNNKCKLQNISLNSLGMCNECVEIFLSTQELREYKKITINRLNNSDLNK